MTDTTGDSPTRAKNTHTSEYRATHVADARTTLTNDIPEVREVELERLMDAVLPVIPPDKLKSVYENLISKGFINGLERDKPRWGCLPRDPSAAKTNETQVFKFVEEIVKTVNCAHSETETLDVKCLADDDSTPFSSRHNSSRPDGFFYLGKLQEKSSQVNWADIFTPMEFKNVMWAGLW